MSKTSVENALQVLKLFSMDEPELGVTKISEKLGVAKSTAYRLLASLAEEGFVFKDSNSNLYSLGLSVIPMMEVVQSQIPITLEAKPILSKLVINTNENAHLCILEGLEVVYLETIEGFYASNDLIHIGKRKPAHCTSGGKAILAFDQSLKEIAPNQLKRYTPYTITEKEEFKRQLETIRKESFVISKQEYREHIIAIAVPVFNDKQKVIASISITIDKKRYSDKLANRYINDLKHATAELTKIITLRKRSELYE